MKKKSMKKMKEGIRMTKSNNEKDELIENNKNIRENSGNA